MTRGTWIALCLAGVQLLACGSDSTAERAALSRLGEGCLLDSDCPKNGEACVFQRCHRECEVTPDCKKYGFDTLCLKIDEKKVCQLGDEVRCDAKDPCPSPLVCKANTCRVSCATASDCTPGQQCVDAVCVEDYELVDGGLPPPLLCTYNSDCGDGLICLPSRQCGRPCKADKDCTSGQKCVDEACVTPGTGPTTLPAHCKSGAKDGDESAPDCGGSCLPCTSGNACGKAADCISAVCTGSTCQEPTCSDGVRNGSESGKDCGGPSCPACAAAQSCSAPSDCATGVCKSGLCVDPGCADGLKNGGESDVDCGGGVCPPCDGAKACVIGGDCNSGVCAGFACAQPSCSDGVKNGSETGVDCGGGCSPCGVGATCAAGGDCSSGVCQASTCAAATCTDSTKNGGETDVDCGGPDCSKCAAGKTCSLPTDCSGGACAGNVCKALHTLTVALAGTGAGSVQGSAVGIDCGPSCSADVAEGITVQLSASAASGSTFSGWSGGGCSGTGTCAVTVSAAVTVTATFGGTAPGATLYSKQFGGGVGRSAATTDSAGNVILAGSMDGGLNLGGGTLTPVGTDGFIAKYLPNLEYVWSRKLSGAGTQHAVRAVALAGGDVVIAGRTVTAAADVDLGGGLLSCSANALLLARYAGANGQHLWSKCVGQNVTDIRALLLDAAGNVVLAGTLGAGTTDLGAGPLVAEGSDIVVATFSPAGAAISSKRFGAAGNDVGSDLARTSGGWLLVGACVGSVDFGGGKVTTALGGEDICVARLDAAFGAVWVRQIGGLLGDRARAAGFTPAGKPLVAATFRDQVDFDTGIADIAAGNEDIVLMRLDDTTGAIEWHKVYGGSGGEFIQDLLVHPASGAVTLAGGSLSLGVSFGGPVIAGGRSFAVKLDAAGAFLSQNVSGDSYSVETLAPTVAGGSVFAFTNPGNTVGAFLYVLAP